MAISRAQELKQLLPGLNALFGEEYTTYDNQHEEITQLRTLRDHSRKNSNCLDLVRLQ